MCTYIYIYIYIYIYSTFYIAFLAFAARTRDLKSQLLLNCHSAPDPHVDSAITSWTASHNIQLPDNTSAIKQHAWDAPVIAADKASLWTSLTDRHNRARLLAVSSSHSGDWLHAIPRHHVEQDSTMRQFG